MEPVIVREARFDDEVFVQNLCQRNGLPGERSDQAWKWIWGKNRFYKSDWPIGWILESDKKVVGFIGNIARAYSFRGREWIAGVARAFVVDELFRAHSLRLVASFFQQKGADLLIFSSANSESEAVYRLARASCIPQQDYHNDLFWIVSPHSFSVSLLRKRGVGKFLSALISGIISPFLSLEMLLRRRWANNSVSEIEIISPDEMTNEFDEFWSKLQRYHSDRLLSYRDRDSIAWQFSNECANTRNPVIFTLRIDGLLAGYAIVTRVDSPKFNLKRMMITDLIVLDDDPDKIGNLIQDIYTYAKKQKMAMLQMVGFPSFVRSALKPLYPFMHTLPYTPFWYFVVNPELKDPLQNESAWYATTFDGDSSL